MKYWIKFLYLVYRDVLDRKLQAEFTGEVLARAVHPIVMISYLTNKHHGRDYQRIVQSGKVKVRQATTLSGDNP